MGTRTTWLATTALLVTGLTGSDATTAPSRPQLAVEPLGGRGPAPPRAWATGPVLGSEMAFCGNAPTCAVTGDWDGDGTVDVAIGGVQNVMVVRNRGDASFRTPRLALDAVQALDGASADLDGDGDLDLAFTLSTASGAVGILVGDGSGAFADGGTLPAGDLAYGIRAADLDADGAWDLVTADNLDDTLSVFLGAGDATFAPRTTLPAGFMPSYLLAADLDGDGDRDLACAHETGCDVFVGDGSGGFGPRTTYALGSRTRDVDAADLDRDGDLDLLCGDAAGTLLFNAGDGTFPTAGSFAPSQLPLYVRSVDLQADGLLDVVNVNLGEVTSVHPGDGAGGFGAPRDVRTGRMARRPAVADLDGDRLDDLLLPVGFSSRFVVLLSDGVGGFGSLELPSGQTAEKVALEDLDGDGGADLGVANGDGEIVLRRGAGDGTFGPPSTLTVGLPLVDLVAPDLDGDGRRDLVTISPAENAVFVLRQDTVGAFAAPTTSACVGTPQAVASGDVNGDGSADLVVAGSAGQTFGVLLGTGSGGFAPFFAYPTGSMPVDIVLLDVDLDGNLDVATSNQLGSDAGVSRGAGNGSFESLTLHPVGPSPRAIAAGDLDLDGLSDLVVAHLGPTTNSFGEVSVLSNTGRGSFGLRSKTTVGQFPTDLALADLDLDGRLEVLATDERIDSGSLRILRGRGDGSLEPATWVATGRLVHSVAARDLDGDGDPDVAITQAYLDQGVSVLFDRRFR